MQNFPEYYNEQLKAAINKFNGLKKDDCFAFITDVHCHDCSLTAVPLLKAFAKETALKKLFCGGDFAYAFGTKDDCLSDTQKCLDYIAKAKPELEVFNVRGNHDITIRTSWEEKSGYTHPKDLTNALLLSKNSPVTNAMNDEACYYIDDELKKMRYVVINTSDSQSENSSAFWGVNYSAGEKQLEWLAENAFNFENGEGWTVVAFGHIPCSPKISDYATELKGLNDLLTAFKNKRKHEFADFSNSKAEFAAYICGHNHKDDSATDDGVLHISSGSEACYNDDVFKRTLGTITETLADVFAINKSERTIFAVRLGAGNDRVFKY